MAVEPNRDYPHPLMQRSSLYLSYDDCFQIATKLADSRVDSNCFEGRVRCWLHTYLSGASYGVYFYVELASKQGKSTKALEDAIAECEATKYAFDTDGSLRVCYSRDTPCDGTERPGPITLTHTKPETYLLLKVLEVAQQLAIHTGSACSGDPSGR